MRNAELAIITTLYNPIGYKRRIENWKKFRSLIHENIWIAECSFDGKFIASNELNHIRIEASENSLLWQKERLLNIILENLPRKVKYVAWVDCDILFENSNWVEDAIQLLTKQYVVQLFDVVHILDAQQERWATVRGLISHVNPTMSRYIPRVYDDSEAARQFLETLTVHGHTGFAWAARREVLDEVGFLDRLIVGGADYFMAHAWMGCPIPGNLDPKVWAGCIGSKLWEQTSSWTHRASAIVDGRVGFVRGAISHLYHGNIADRRYDERNSILINGDYNPSEDIEIGANKLWVLTARGARLKIPLQQHFVRRAEDS